jgi:hypothetical protein
VSSGEAVSITHFDVRVYHQFLSAAMTHQTSIISIRNIGNYTTGGDIIGRVP